MNPSPSGATDTVFLWPSSWRCFQGGIRGPKGLPVLPREEQAFSPTAPLHSVRAPTDPSLEPRGPAPSVLPWNKLASFRGGPEWGSVPAFPLRQPSLHPTLVPPPVLSVHLCLCCLTGTCCQVSGLRRERRQGRSLPLPANRSPYRRCPVLPAVLT